MLSHLTYQFVQIFIQLCYLPIHHASSSIAQFPVQNRSKHFTLYFPDRPVHSDAISASLGSIQPCAAINARRLLVLTSTTVYSYRYSFKQLSEMEQCRVKKLTHSFNTAAQDSNPGSRSREPEALPLSHCALHDLSDPLLSKNATNHTQMDADRVAHSHSPS